MRVDSDEMASLESVLPECLLAPVPHCRDSVASSDFNYSQLLRLALMQPLVVPAFLLIGPVADPVPVPEHQNVWTGWGSARGAARHML
jgi:hypothetical protein